jgi:hypothetical protein
MSKIRKASYPSYVTGDGWEFVVPYLTWMTEDTRQREYPLGSLFNALRAVHGHIFIFPTIFRHRPSCISGPGPGSLPKYSKQCHTTC